MENIASVLYRYEFSGESWIGKRLDAPGAGAIKVSNANPDSNRFFFTFASFLNPTRLYHSPEIGTSWLENGRVYAYAHIRGGGEFGKDWHHSARRENRQTTFADFIAATFVFNMPMNHALATVDADSAYFVSVWNASVDRWAR